MSSKFLIQTMLLLCLGQWLLGGLGWLAVGVTPWLGLPLTLLLIWLIRRLAVIFREEAAKADRNGQATAPKRLSFFVALVAQLPGLALLPFWAPPAFATVWQGAVLPITATLGLLWPEGAALAQPWLWLAVILEMGLFVSVATAPEPRYQPQMTAQVKPEAGDWAPARRHSDLKRRGTRVR